jgi:hypothetical protein
MGIAIITKDPAIMISRTFIRALTGSAMALALSAAAHAEIDAKKVTDAVIAQMAGNGIALTAGSSEAQGANVMMKDVSVSMAGGAPAKLGDVTLENVTEDGAGYIAGKISAPAFDKTEGDNTIKFGGASFTNVHIGAPDETDPIKKMFFYEGATMGPLTVGYKGKEAVRVEGANFVISPYKAGETIQMTGEVTGFHADFSASSDPKAIETMTALGYLQMEGKIGLTGSWNPADGRMAITETFDIKDLGKLGVLMDISGYTPKFVSDLQAMNKTLEGKDDGAKGLAFMGLMQQLTFNTLSIRFDDSSFTGKIFDYAAKQQNKPREDLVNQVKGMVPVLAMQLQDAELAQKAAGAVSAYLDAPKNIEVKAAPPAPVSFAILAATGSMNPMALVKQLNLSVTANQ